MSPVPEATSRIMSESRQQRRRALKPKMQPHLAVQKGGRIRPVEQGEIPKPPLAMRCRPRVPEVPTE